MKTYSVPTHRTCAIKLVRKVFLLLRFSNSCIHQWSTSATEQNPGTADAVPSSENAEKALCILFFSISIQFTMEELSISVESLNLELPANAPVVQCENSEKPAESALKGKDDLTESATKRTLAKTAVYYHPACSLHRIPDHPEQPLRVDRILSALRETWPVDLTFRESKPVTKEHILLFHTPALLSRFQKLAENALMMYQKKKTVSYLPIDMDTTVMWQTRAAAFHAAGSVICALDHMYAPNSDVNKIDTAFCCVRPPGHHAERDKAGGFCFFNNVGIGARYAQRKHGVGKVAILDPDVHHGNGMFLLFLLQ